jgi:lysozyme family protein
MMYDFPPSLAYILQSEGGLVDDPRDPGGRTDAGVTQHTYDHWRVTRGLRLRDVADITPDEKSAIYRTMYWAPVLGDQLPAGVDYQVFDCGVNSGPYRASCLLQQVLNVDVDGYIGPETIAAARAADPKQIISAFTQAHLAYLQTRPTWATYAHGFTNRANTVEARADAMLA